MKTVLISGASVAGLTLAHWLRRHGCAPTVVERAPDVRPGGQAVDVRGVALDVLERMGVLDGARRARTTMRGMTMLAADGTERWRSTERALSSGRLDGADIELLRDDLARLLYGQAREGVEYLFGDSVTGLDQGPEGVRARFLHAPARTFDAVVGADGLRSTVRRLAFGPEWRYVHHLGAYLAVFSAENVLGLDDWQVWIQDDGVGCCVYPVRGNTELRVTLGFRSGPLDYDHRDVEGQKAFSAGRLSGLGWETPRLVKAMWEAPDFYFDAAAQVRMKHWSNGAVALVGDAGYAPSGLSGQGASMALVGGYVLAEEIAAADGDGGPGESVRSAFARYEERLRPFVPPNQALATENPDGVPSEESMERAKWALTLER
jgi:2-polyprenyl-6-methoxyphenol hydroxylase-like FAD-dependent oxidoreductase